MCSWGNGIPGHNKSEGNKPRNTDNPGSRRSLCNGRRHPHLISFKPPVLEYSKELYRAQYALFVRSSLFSMSNILDREDISYVIPLKRNSAIISKQLAERFKEIFVYNERPIIFWKIESRLNIHSTYSRTC